MHEQKRDFTKTVAYCCAGKQSRYEGGCTRDCLSTWTADGVSPSSVSVVGYIAEGAALFQVEGEELQRLEAGSAFYEPAGSRIARFDNSSETAPMRFLAYYLLNGEQELIEMLADE